VTRIGFIGLGIMGRPMAMHLVRAGFDVTVHSRRRESAAELEAEGATWAETVATASEDRDVVITMLPDSPDVELVALGQDGIYDSAGPGTLHIDMSSIRPQVAQALAEAAGARGLRTLDAPVSGGEKGAVEATLSIMVGGDDADFEAARRIFETLGKTIVLVGPPGAGQTVKAVNQLIVGGVIELVAEGLLLVERSGVDVAAALAVLQGGLAGSRVLEVKGATMHERQFAPGFRIDLHHKDMGIALDTARSLGVPLPLGGTLAQLFVSARSQGLGGLDHSGLLAALENQAGQDGEAQHP
jgi:2-hydroxy-3-oxopropionate reductase